MYIANGQYVDVVAKTETGVIVRAYYAYDDDTEIPGPLMEVPAVYQEPPVELLHETVCELQAQIKQLQEQKRTLRCDIERAKRDRTELLDRLKVHETLERIDKFLHGDIAYIVCGTTAMTPQELTVSSYDATTRLLSLSGSLKDRTVRWVLNQYRDGSGLDQTCTLCSTREEAEALVRARILGALNRAGSSPSLYVLCELQKHARVLDIEIPEIEEKIQALRREQARKDFEKAQQAMAAAKKLLADPPSTPYSTADPY